MSDSNLNSLHNKKQAHLKSLGDYEKQVLLGLSRSLTAREITQVRHYDSGHRLLFSIISNSYEQRLSVCDCKKKFFIVFEPTLYG